MNTKNVLFTVKQETTNTNHDNRIVVIENILEKNDFVVVYRGNNEIFKARNN